MFEDVPKGSVKGSLSCPALRPVRQAHPQLSGNPFFWLCDLSQRREVIIVLGNISVKNGTVMFCHFKCAMSQKPLKSKSIPAAVNQILSGKCVPEQVNGSLADTPPLIVFDNGQPQSVL